MTTNKHKSKNDFLNYKILKNKEKSNFYKHRKGLFSSTPKEDSIVSLKQTGKKKKSRIKMFCKKSIKI